MCVAMVIIYKKTLEKKGGDDVTSKSTSLGPIPAQTMSEGTALFTCGLMEASRCHQMVQSCSAQQRPVAASLESIWDSLPEVSPGHCGWTIGGPSGSISNLLEDLSLTEPHSTAPPNKRQCRSLSCSDDLGRSTWRPQGSRVWTTVEKRRCLSGGSVQRTSTVPFGFPSMQRSSSFSLPFPGTPCTPLASEPPAQPLYLSHEQMPSPRSSPDSTPELERRCGQVGLSRSRSQPCVLNDKKIGVKRRRPADSHKQRPSLDLAKMTQKLRSFHSLSCPGIPAEDHSESNPAVFNLRSSVHFENGHSNEHRTDDAESGTKDLRGNPPLCPTIEDVDWTPSDCGETTPVMTNGKDGEALWAGRCSMRRDVYQLGGELDIEQIERN